MVKDDTLFDSFVTVTKRLPLRARFVVAICMLVVVYELISGFVELNDDTYYPGRLRNKRPSEVGKIRERKEINPESVWERVEETATTNHGRKNLEPLNSIGQKEIVQISREIDNNVEELKDNVRLKHRKFPVNQMDGDHKQSKNTTTTVKPSLNAEEPIVKIVP